MNIWTIGHSTRTLDEFIQLLRDNGIELLVDVRHYPGSRRYPHFGGGALSESITAAGIEYRHVVALGGRRAAKPSSRNTALRNEAFRGYADYMETAEFRQAADSLMEAARDKRVAIMCAEAVWWRCHRSMIADYLKNRGFCVCHILAPGKVQEHPYTSAARIVDGKLEYSEEGQLPFDKT